MNVCIGYAEVFVFCTLKDQLHLTNIHTCTHRYTHLRGSSISHTYIHTCIQTTHTPQGRLHLTYIHTYMHTNHTHTSGAAPSHIHTYTHAYKPHTHLRGSSISHTYIHTHTSHIHTYIHTPQGQLHLPIASMQQSSPTETDFYHLESAIACTHPCTCCTPPPKKNAPEVCLCMRNRLPLVKGRRAVFCCFVCVYIYIYISLYTYTYIYIYM